MSKLSAVCVVIVLGLVATGCSRTPQPARAGAEFTEAQVREIKGFGGEMLAQYGTEQPPLEYWVKAMPWLEFKRLELRPDGCYFIMEESDSEERGYVRVANPHDFYEAHKSDPGYEGIDVFLYRYRVRK